MWASIINLVKEQRVTAEKPVDEKTSEPPKKKVTLLAVSSESDSEQEDNSIENSVQRYGTEPAISPDSCPLEWWSKHTQLACPTCTEVLGHTCNLRPL